MSLARAWRRQLFGASSAALIVPFAMFAALVVLALGGGFSQVGVLGQIFGGPPAPSAGGGGDAAAGAASARSSVASLPLIPAPADRPASARGVPAAVVPAGAGRGAVVPVSSGGSSRTGGALGAPVAVAPVVTAGGGGAPPRPSPVSAGALGSTPPPPPPQPQPGPQPQSTPVDQIVNAVTPVTQQVPAPVGPIVTQAVQAAGSAADGLLAPGGAPPSVPQGLGTR